MKCPKCGYLGFETTDRCRNCQYDFSLAPFTSEPELTLHGTDEAESPADFELSPIKRQTDSLSATALDLDRLFGTHEPRQPSRSGDVVPAVVAEADPPPALEPVPEPIAVVEPVRIAEPAFEPEPTAEAAPEPAEEPESSHLDDEGILVAHDSVMAIESAPEVPDDAMQPATDDAALPFDESPLVPPPAARPPLAVRRSSPEVPRNRPRTTRPVKLESLNLEAPAPPASPARDATETVSSLMEAPTLGVRVGAGLIDVLLLLVIDAVVLYLTLRVTGLQNTIDDLRVLPPVPLVGFIALLTFGYVAAFTVAGGQTIGTMMLSLRVIGDDGRPLDAAGGMLRALGCMLVPVTLGLSYLPALFTSDHRALHDRLAGTRVVQE
ncbi:MAG: RDD family protein [Acidimicrobiia bacterium]